MTAYAQRVDGHYSVGGVLLPAVSTILAPIKGTYPDDPKWANRGTLMHAGLQAQLQGTVDGYVDDWLRAEIDRRAFVIDRRWVYPYVAHIVDWAAENIESAENIEGPSVSLLAGHAGTADVRAARLRGDGGLWLIDAKSQADATPEKWHVAQLAGLHYQTHAALEGGAGAALTRCNRFGNLYVTPDGVTLRTWTVDQINDAYCRCFWTLLCQYKARQVVTMTEATVEEWRSQRRVAGYWPVRTTAASRRQADAALWTRPLTEAL